MSDARLLICTPSYSGDYCSAYVRSVVAATKDLQAYGVKTLYLTLDGMHWIDIARDVLAELFLKSDCTHMLQVDADVGFPADAPRQLLSHGVDIVGGAYPCKHDSVRVYPAKTGERVGNLLRAEGLPGGFMCVSRRVIETLAGKDKYAVATLDYGSVECSPLYTRQMWPGGYTGEDFAFCNRARAAGFELWLDPDITFSHVGRKAWTGNYKADICES